MAVIMHLQVCRKPGTTPEEFRQHYENKHISLMRKISGDLFPVSHIRRYLNRRPTERPGQETPDSLLVGSPDSFAFDAIAEITYRDMEHFQLHSALLQNDDNAPVVQDDCDKFMNTALSAIVLFYDSDVVETIA